MASSPPTDTAPHYTHHQCPRSDRLDFRIALSGARGPGSMLAYSVRCGIRRDVACCVCVCVTQPSTGKRGRRRRDMGRGPLGPVQSMSNMHTDQGVSRRGQPVQPTQTLTHTSPPSQHVSSRPVDPYPLQNLNTGTGHTRGRTRNGRNTRHRTQRTRRQRTSLRVTAR